MKKVTILLIFILSIGLTLVNYFLSKTVNNHVFLDQTGVFIDLRGFDWIAVFILIAIVFLVKNRIKKTDPINDWPSSSWDVKPSRRFIDKFIVGVVIHLFGDLVFVAGLSVDSIIQNNLHQGIVVMILLVSFIYAFLFDILKPSYSVIWLFALLLLEYVYGQNYFVELLFFPIFLIAVTIFSTFFEGSYFFWEGDGSVTWSLDYSFDLDRGLISGVGLALGFSFMSGFNFGFLFSLVFGVVLSGFLVILPMYLISRIKKEKLLAR